MICIISALYSEAMPFVKALGLKEKGGWSGSRVFEGDNFLLGVSGPGVINSSILTTKICERLSKEIGFLLNIGVCGMVPGNKTGIKIGKPLLVSRVAHEHEVAIYYPEILFEHNLKEVSLLTVSKPLYRPSSNASSPQGFLHEIVDMEAYGIFRAAQPYLPPSRIHMVKVPSDELEPQSVDREMIFSLMERALHDVLALIEEMKSVLPTKKHNFLQAKYCILPHGLSKEEFEEICYSSVFTETMRHQLFEIVAYGRSNNMAWSIIRHRLKDFLSVKERRRAKEILKKLRGELQEIPLDLD